MQTIWREVHHFSVYISTMEPLIQTIDSGLPWPRIVILWGVHGNEPTGVEVIKMLQDSLSIDTWKVDLLIAHPQAIEKRTRFIEKDLNRSFGMQQDGTLESRLANRIEAYIQWADMVIDIHNTVTNSSPRFVISEHKQLLPYVDVPYVVSGFWNHYAWSTDQYADRVWSIWLCLEAWWIQDGQDHTSFALDTIRNLLKVTGNIQQPPRTYTTVISLCLDKMYRVTQEYTSSRKYKDFEQISAWECIWNDGDVPIVAEKDWFLLFSSQYATKWDIWYMFLCEE
jgi:hypothetical protein